MDSLYAWQVAKYDATSALPWRYSSSKPWWIKIINKRPPDYVIGADSDPYMLRWWVIPRNPVFNIYLHCFLRSDEDEALHDHPWWNFSRILLGGYTEHTIAAGGIEKKQIFKSGDWKFRTAKSAHRVELHNGPCWSLFVTGPRVREWGFHCKNGWKMWKDFVKRREGGNERGSGCGEP
jgi:hypothetical protein